MMLGSDQPEMMGRGQQGMMSFRQAMMERRMNMMAERMDMMQMTEHQEAAAETRQMMRGVVGGRGPMSWEPEGKSK